ncbi:PKD domain-containing protein [Ferruginibacter sp.]
MRKLVFLIFIFFSTAVFSQKNFIAAPINLISPRSAQTILIPCLFNGDFSFEFNPCNPSSVKFIPSTTLFSSVEWDFGDLTPHSTLNSPTHVYTAYGNYIVKMILFGPSCSDTITKNISINLQNDNTLITTNDTTICLGTSKLLKTQLSNNFCWTPTTYLNNPLLNNPTTSTPTNITYYYTAEVLGNNLIVNGNFSAGNTGFTSGYTHTTPNTSEGQYFIGTNPVAWNPGAAPCTDHTTGFGNMMMVNGAATPGTIVWQETVNVTTNTNYNFACWVQSIYFAEPAQLQFSINNILIGPVFSPGSVTCNWQRFFSNWNSGNNTTAVISIVNLNTVLGGNDFALDDISFAPVSIKRDSVKITVDAPVVSATGNTTICTGSSAQLNATGSATYSWSPVTGLSNPSIANPVSTPAATTSYTVTGTTINGCTAQSGVTVTVLPAANFDFSYQQNVCNPLSVQFFTAGANPVNPYWSFGDGNTLLGNNPTHVYTALGNYTVKYHIDNATCPDTITKIISLQLSNADIVLTSDTTICFGSTKLLRAQSSGNFCWSPTTYLNNPALSNPTTSAPTNITYFYTAEVLGNNIIVNGDFSAGNTGFTSAYTYASTNTIQGEYFIGTNPVAWNPGAAPCVDHTSSGGNMMLVNGATTPGTIVWRETVNVTANTNYNFACWVQSIYFAEPAQLQFSINNILIGSVFSPGSTTCNWQRFFSNWNSGSNTTAIISIVNLNTVAGGNDFALDDISFAPVSIKRDSVKITVDTPVVNTIADVSVCAGVPVQLNATGASTYVWTPATGLSNPNIANPLAIPQTNTRYTVNGTTVNGCFASDFVDITVLPKPVITKTADTTICKNSSIQLNASGGTSYAWSPAATLNNANIANPVATPTAPVTKYIVTVTNNNVNTCSNTDSVKITLRPAPVFTVSPSKSTCLGTAVQLNASGGDSYLWNPANLVSNAVIANPATTTGTTTNYSVTITETNCNVSATLFTTVTVNPVPVVTVSKSNDIDCSIEFANLLASGAAQYTWTPAIGLNNAAIYNPVAKPITTTKYIVKGDNAFGCSDYDSLTVTVTKTGNSGYYMPNSFTPNGDGKNDCFGIKYWGIIEQLDFFIYNRYGEKVFYTNNPNKCWDGLYKSNKPELGNYVYYIKAKTACGTVEKKGNVILIR